MSQRVVVPLSPANQQLPPAKECITASDVDSPEDINNHVTLL
jgi:hypothetical protein